MLSQLGPSGDPCTGPGACLKSLRIRGRPCRRAETSTPSTRKEEVWPIRFQRKKRRINTRWKRGGTISGAPAVEARNNRFATGRTPAPILPLSFIRLPNPRKFGFADARRPEISRFATERTKLCEGHIPGVFTLPVRRPQNRRGPRAHTASAVGCGACGCGAYRPGGLRRERAAAATVPGRVRSHRGADTGPLRPKRAGPHRRALRGRS